MGPMVELLNGVNCKVVDWFPISETLLIEMKHTNGTYSIVKCKLNDCKRLYWENGENGDTIYENKET